MNTTEHLRVKLAVLSPVRLDIRDDSAQHVGHAGSREGGHYAVTIVSERFRGLTTLARHRLVYDAIGDLSACGIHALAIVARTPEETTSY
ncbi:MAG: BolA family transcriptional regulator [Rhodocyclaceae bacterium]|nr:BolA family transcriptional regulator [Rhodocyclaceae bacterium]